MILPRRFWGEAVGDDFAGSVDALIERHGGVIGIFRRMEQIGLSRLARSWSSDAHEPISGEQLHQLFGTGVLRALAAKLDLQPRDLVRRLSMAVPQAMVRLASNTGKKNH